MKQLSIVGGLVLLVMLCLFPSCVKKPFACFLTDVNEDSIHVNQWISFNAHCSINSEDYFWEFYDNDDSIEFGAVVRKNFADTGKVKVYLMATKGKNSSSVSREISIHP